MANQQQLIGRSIIAITGGQPRANKSTRRGTVTHLQVTFRESGPNAMQLQPGSRYSHRSIN